MNTSYKPYFGFKREPFPTDVPTRDLILLSGMLGVKERIQYCLDLGGVMIITGEVGSGKSTSLRYSASKTHPSEVAIIEVIGNSGAVSEIYKSICFEMGIQPSSTGKSRLIREVKLAIEDTVKSKKQKVLLQIDEAHLMRPEVFAELHTLMQFDYDSKNLISLVLCGQTNLIDKMHYRGSAPLASRVIARSHLETLNKEQLAEYIKHHTKIAGVTKSLFDETALTAIFQGSGGLLRKANSLARGGQQWNKETL